ncbi:hypothetical protein Huta_0612 [Halorhabdus utahensis DSM 12940]|uniref:Uncharacterized protein n=1 Tax=Halorhabdus utahensis (strain DSM 12940 / JCM 11049 / AX-2) TaxID=519442 RepID=C7NSY8_HALUD|nr:hypothetical protein Huta_0612 [Halorhabdus utahensis DSM 12940]WEL22024.1 hypothetical protein HBNXHr_1969 [Halorhabdus sp. BNX81]
MGVRLGSDDRQTAAYPWLFTIVDSPEVGLAEPPLSAGVAAMT